MYVTICKTVLYAGPSAAALSAYSSYLYRSDVASVEWKLQLKCECFHCSLTIFFINTPTFPPLQSFCEILTFAFQQTRQVAVSYVQLLV